MTDLKQLWDYFEKRAFSMLDSNARTAIVWQEAFENAHFVNRTMPSGTVVEVWKGPESVQRALEAGLDVILAYGWYVTPHTVCDVY
jgi:N-acetyl-beta-hexosaminidase